MTKTMQQKSGNSLIQNTHISKLRTDITNSRLKEADRLLQSDDPSAALLLASEELDENPDDPLAAFLITKAFIDMKRPGFAQVFGKHNVRQLENSAGAWVNLGNAFQLSFDLELAIKCSEKALELDPDGPDTFGALNNLAITYSNNGDPIMAMEYALKAIALSPNDAEVSETMGFANLQMHKWTPGWEQYNAGLGRTRDRTVRNYNNVPVWDGTKGKTVVLYAEQGLGDEIFFAQIIPQIIKDCDLIVDTCTTLYTLFNGSFDCPVYKTRYVDNPEWPKTRKIDAKLSFSQGMEMYRSRNEHFTGEPYLKANPEKRGWWNAILSQYEGRKVGIAWTAGLLETGKKRRTLKKEDIILLNDGSTFVCLEYKDAKEDIEWLRSQGMTILDFGMFINGHKNYEDTAALVMELDHVIAPTTTVADLCGALGQDCDVFVPTIPHWRQHGDNVWYNSVNYVRQEGTWAETIDNYRRQHA